MKNNDRNEARDPCLEDTSYVPDQWDSIFQTFDDEDIRREAEIRRKKEDEKEFRTSMAGQLLESLKEILDRGPGYERATEIKRLFGQSSRGFSKGNPEIYRQKMLYVKEPVFLQGFKELCEQYEIDKESYAQLLKMVYPGDMSQTVKDMRIYLYEKKTKAPRRPLKKMNYLLMAGLMLLAFLFQYEDGTPAVYTLLPTLLVGVHLVLYRVFYPGLGASGAHFIVGIFELIVLFFYGESISNGGVKADGVFFVTTCFFDMVFITGLLCIKNLCSKQMVHNLLGNVNRKNN